MKQNKFIYSNSDKKFYKGYESQDEYICDATKAMKKKKEKLREILSIEIKKRSDDE